MKFLLFASSFYLFLLTQCFSTNKNIILFITDDQSPDAGCYGNKKIKMPNLDALAEDGTLFTNAFATTASCSASRSVVLTGLHNHLNGQYGHQHNYHILQLNLLYMQSQQQSVLPLSNHSRLLLWNQLRF